LRQKFLAPARYDDELHIDLWLTELTRVRLTVAAKISSASGKIFVEAETDHVCTGLNEKPKRIPAELAEACQRYLIQT
jgi:acyl-CoA thioester hydrolase